VRKLNPIDDHLSSMENIIGGPIPIDDCFCNEQLASIKVASPWFSDYLLLLLQELCLLTIPHIKSKKFLYDLRPFTMGIS
jgi:hypothetical protein